MQPELQLSLGTKSGAGSVLFVLDLLRLCCEETHSEVLMAPSQSADTLKPSTLSLFLQPLLPLHQRTIKDEPSKVVSKREA